MPDFNESGKRKQWTPPTGKTTPADRPRKDDDFNEFRHLDDFETARLGVVTGTIVKYGDVATFPWGTEEVKAGAYGKLDGVDLYANRMHVRQQPLGSTLNGRVKVTDSPEALRGEVRLPDTSSGRDTAYEVADKILRGLSKEFRGVRDSFPKENHRVIEEARLFGFGVVDRPAYPQSGATMRTWQEYMETRGGVLAPVSERGVTVTLPVLAESGIQNPREIVQTTENLGQLLQRDIPAWARQSTYVDHKGRLIFIGGDLDCRYEDFDVEERQMPRCGAASLRTLMVLRRWPETNTCVSCPAPLRIRLGGEILGACWRRYTTIRLAGRPNGVSVLTDTDDALEFRTGRIPETSVNRDFISKLRGGFVRGVTAGWALAGQRHHHRGRIPGGGTRIVVKKAMLCEAAVQHPLGLRGREHPASPRAAGSYQVPGGVVALTVAELGAALRLTTDPASPPAEPLLGILHRQLQAATEEVNGYASGAPEVVRDEATIRMVGYLFERPDSLDPFRLSGALKMLSRWHEIVVAPLIATATVTVIPETPINPYIPSSCRDSLSLHWMERRSNGISG